MNKKRDTFWDILKGIAIILVVFGHAIQYGSGERFFEEHLYFEDKVFIFIYSFHMPLFMLISGYMFYFSINRYTVKEILISRCKGLLLPIFSSTVLIFGVKEIILEGIMQYGIRFTVKSFINLFLGNLWFLWAIFYCSLVVLCTKKFFKDNLLVYVIIFILSFFWKDAYNFSYYKFMFPFFVIGYFFNKSNGKKYLENVKWKWVIFCGIIFIGMLTFYNRDSYIYTTGHYILKDNSIRQLGIDMYRMVIGAVGSIFVILFMKKILFVINSEQINKTLSFIGKNSIGIYIFSGYIFYYMLLEITQMVADLNYLLAAMETIIILGISLAISAIIQKNKILSLTFLGGR